MNEYLEKIYLNPGNSAAFSGPEKLYQIVKREGKFKVSRNKIKAWLNDRDEYSVQKDIKRKFRRRRIITSGVDVEWGLDLASVENYKFIQRLDKISSLCRGHIFPVFTYPAVKEQTSKNSCECFRKNYQKRSRTANCVFRQR